MPNDEHCPPPFCFIVEAIVELLFIVCLLALSLSLLSFRGDGARRAYFEQRLAQQLPDNECPFATVIVPVKGYDHGLAENLAALAAQDYPGFELVITVRERGDIDPSVIPPDARLVVAGPGDGATSHKITNLLAAIDSSKSGHANDSVGSETRIYAFADSDGRPSTGWLSALAAELRDPQVGAATGYRWYVPEPPDAASNLRSVWNAAIAGTLGPGDAPFCWGGAMAITRANFELCQVRRFWMGQISDDFELARAVHAAGLRVAFAPGAMVPSLDCVRLAEFFGWARRQLILTRVYAPKLWWQALVAHVIYVAAYAGAVLLGLRGVTWLPCVIVVLGVIKAAERARLFERALPGRRSQVESHARMVTVATFVWLILLVASAFSRTIVWRGVKYRLGRPV